jgi:hypothetical protein
MRGRIAAVVAVAEPTRERVEAYEKALGCNRVSWGECWRHENPWTDLGCPVAVAAARVEAERVAGLVLAAAHDVDALRAVVEKVRAILDEWREEGEIRDALYDALHT